MSTPFNFIIKKMPCGCVVSAKIYPGFSTACITNIFGNGCGFCTEEQRLETVQHLWITETEKYTWQELLNSYGWSNDHTNKNNSVSIEDIQKEKINKLKMNFPYGEKIDRSLDSNEID